MNLFFKRKVIHELTFEDGDFSTSFGDMERHIETPTNGCGVGYFNGFTYPYERNPEIDDYLIKNGIAVRNKDGDLEVTEKTSGFIRRIDVLITLRLNKG
jgi:hypothetical protein